MFEHRPMAATESGLGTTLGSSVASTELAGPGTTLADERLLPVVPALRPLLPGRGLRRGTTVTVSRSAALALALVAGASGAGSWMAAVGLPDLGIVAAAETGIALERLAGRGGRPPGRSRRGPGALPGPAPARPGPPPRGQGPRARRRPGPPRPLARAGRPAPGRHHQQLDRPRPGPRQPPGPQGRGPGHRPRRRHPRTPGPPLAPVARREHRPGRLGWGCGRTRDCGQPRPPSSRVGYAPPPGV